MQRFRIYFGLSIPEQHQKRLNRIALTGFDISTTCSRVGESFPDGFTVYEAKGVWRDTETGFSLDEYTMVVEILSDAPDAESRVTELARWYRAAFAQDAVMVTSERIDSLRFITADD